MTDHPRDSRRSKAALLVVAIRLRGGDIAGILQLVGRRRRFRLRRLLRGLAFIGVALPAKHLAFLQRRTVAGSSLYIATGREKRKAGAEWQIRSTGRNRRGNSQSGGARDNLSVAKPFVPLPRTV